MSASEPAKQQTLDFAFEVVGAYGDAILESCKTQHEIMDTSKLPFPKETIRCALLRLIDSTQDQATREQLVAGLYMLPAWQEGIGEKGIGHYYLTTVDMAADPHSYVDEFRAAQQIADKWRPLVEKERELFMRDLKTVDSLRQGRLGGG